jgi:peptidoglycan hydrolase-like protein with peptidoglycan-binding domain
MALAPILYSLPAKTEYSYSRSKYEKVPHQGVWALQQSLLNITPELGADFPDGYFGSRTEDAVRRYQANRDLGADGIAGPATQKRIVQGWINSANKAVDTKDGLLDGFAEGEGGWLLAPVNWSVAGGVDVGAVQNRVYDLSGTTVWSTQNGVPTEGLLAKVIFDPNKVQSALDTKSRIFALARDLKSRRDTYFNLAGTKYPYTRGNDKRSWQLAALYHNWPSAAELLAKGGTLPDKEAPWVPQSLRDKGVNTYKEWADHYIAQVTKYVTW